MSTEQGSLVTVSAYGPTAASTRVRISDWLDKTKIQAEVHSYVGGADNQFSTLSRSIPRVIKAERELRKLVIELERRTLLLGRQASPFSSGGIEESLLRAASHSVYDFDDALFDDTAGFTRKLWSKRRLWERSVVAADVVVAGSDRLAEAASELSDRVVMIPSCIEPTHYTPKITYELSENPRAVWIGSRATEKYLEMLEEPLLEMFRRWGLRLTVISAGSADLKRLAPMVDRVSWTRETFAQNLAASDFGIMPLPDTPYARGKCAYKILQYAATGLPIVGSPIGANHEVIRQLGAVAATTSNEWVDGVAGLLQMTSSERQTMGLAGLKAVVAGYSFARWEKSWLEAIRSES